MVLRLAIHFEPAPSIVTVPNACSVPVAAVVARPDADGGVLCPHRAAVEHVHESVGRAARRAEVEAIDCLSEHCRLPDR